MNINLTEKQKIKVMNSKMVFDVMRNVLLRENEIDRNKEHMWVCGLATNNKLMYLELVSLGSLSQMVVEPMDVFSWALQKQVAKIILVHNHPSGELVPTAADKDLTNRMIQVGKIVRIDVVDHLIISTQGFYSFDESGLLQDLSESKKYVPGYKEVERLLKEARKIAEKNGIREGKKIGMEKGAEKEKIKMAKRMAKKGYSRKEIIDLTGLSNKDIEKL
jgi:DNA repair protein RadC